MIPWWGGLLLFLAGMAVGWFIFALLTMEDDDE